MTTVIDQLRQLRTVTWDGDLISKDARDELVKAGYVAHVHGFNFLTVTGVTVMIILQLFLSRLDN